MFRWYRGANVCYAYLVNVPSGKDPAVPDSSYSKSQWFTRGWTLQELISPPTVVFFAKNWERIGDRRQRRPWVNYLLDYKHTDRVLTWCRPYWPGKTDCREILLCCSLVRWGKDRHVGWTPPHGYFIPRGTLREVPPAWSRFAWGRYSRETTCSKTKPQTNGVHSPDTGDRRFPTIRCIVPNQRWLLRWRFKRGLERLYVSPTFRVQRDKDLPGWATVKRQSRGVTCCLFSFLSSFVLLLLFAMVILVVRWLWVHGV